MNFIEYHLGDYLKHASHLTLLEHGVFGRLRDVYLVSESPIPDARAERLVGARSPDECAAVRTVLLEFFELRGDAWHRPALDDEIAKFKPASPNAKPNAPTRRFDCIDIARSGRGSSSG